MTQKTKGRGGAREGAGRPALHGPREVVTVRVPPALAARFRALWTRRGVTAGEVFADLVALGEKHLPASPEGRD